MLQALDADSASGSFSQAHARSAFQVPERPSVNSMKAMPDQKHRLLFFPPKRNINTQHIMDTASCGPSNALQNLSKHTQRDRSLQNDISLGARQALFASNKFNQVDRNLQNDFAAFNQGQNSFQQAHYEQLYNQQFPANVEQQRRAEDSQWAQSFQDLNLTSQPQNLSVASNQWQSQFMQQGNVQQPQIRPLNAFATNFMRSGMTGNMAMTVPQPTHQLEHQQLHKQEAEQDLFNQEFANVERELQQEARQVDVTVPEDHSLAATAEQVLAVMTGEATSRSAETNSKFQNSNFLKLMQSIAAKEVALNDSQDKLVTRDGTDIREVPEMPAVMAGGFSGNPLTREARGSHLPDPLAHIPDGALSPTYNSPLGSAMFVQKSMGKKIQMQDWVEDYGMDSEDELSSQWKANFDGEDMFMLRNRENEAYMGYDG
ncbi:hypothetical protein BABINDRAFT_118312 [Babjeviella inositovora NRRL Y-12698]|uniref:Uncharacterized protein n=1 Tax=Babjeviella inositovora NRRL Y-12698 TaxID=984486 RepID=A0A1E3QV68_9ASCO|nr:uncharacterized protein BABINDRAFT_118312 [Babjeviella inositovora NRRL Y-12698]ODQ80942.1 hypothetical protein BABINDRAFT_118312 [Babjeviella inositovora NRRL Y-12698]